MNYFEEIKKALKEKGVKQNITTQTEFKTLGLDSLDLMDMIVNLEQKMGKQISDDKLNDIVKIDDLLKIIEEIS